MQCRIKRMKIDHKNWNLPDFLIQLIELSHFFFCTCFKGVNWWTNSHLGHCLKFWFKQRKSRMCPKQTADESIEFNTNGSLSVHFTWWYIYKRNSPACIFHLHISIRIRVSFGLGKVFKEKIEQEIFELVYST